MKDTEILHSMLEMEFFALVFEKIRLFQTF